MLPLPPSMSRAYAPLSTDPSVATLRVVEVITLCNSLFSEVKLLIEGEIANYSISRGKYIFFDLKDEEEEARLSCFMMAFQLSVPLEDGMRVLVEGRPGIYQKSGQFRITVSKVQPKGEGSLKRSFELLRAKLEAEGLFAATRKRSLPRFVNDVGIVSSADAAGYGDFLKIATQRLPGVHFRFANVAVQGRDAETEICKAFDYLNSHFQLDAIVLIRGGGSIEDLHAFNSESVARAIVRSKAPVLVGVGHERDVSIADFCADLRASTPSNAAQLLLPSREEVRDNILHLTQQGRRRVGQIIQQLRHSTLYKVTNIKQNHIHLISEQRAQVEALLKTITAISPNQTLKRGYSLTCLGQGGTVRSVNQVKAGDRLVTHLADGKIYSVTT